MSFGGQFGFPGQPNPGADILQRSKMMEEANRTNQGDYASRYARINNVPPQANAMQAAMGQPKMSMQQPPMQGPAMPPPQRPPMGSPPPQMPKPPIAQPPMPPENPEMSLEQESITQRMQPKIQEFGASMAAMGNKLPQTGVTSNKKTLGLENDINTALTSEDPIKFSEGIGQFSKFEDMNFNPDTPAGMFQNKINQKYLKSVDEKGNKVYECPLTRKPCGKKTFWQRLQTFFKTLIGVQDRQKAQEEVDKLDRKDPITRSMQSNTEQVKYRAPEQQIPYTASLNYEVQQ